jgi:MoxR-like ATPase
MVMATQNPVEMEGTYPLPEAQRDRFTAQLAMGYPDPTAELAMLDRHGVDNPLDRVEPVIRGTGVAKLSEAVRTVHVAESVSRYTVDLVNATRSSPDLRLGASPRATLHLLRAARAWAAIAGREYVLPDDVQELAVPVLAHRLIASPEAQIARRDATAIVNDLLERVPVPDANARRARSARG